MVMNIPRRRAAAALTALFLGGTCGGTSACGAVHADCTSVAVRTAPVRTAAPYAQLVITASVTTGGRPLAGVPVNFWVKETGSGLPQDFGETIGTERTDATGVARIDRPQGFYGLLLPGRTVTGYYAEFVEGTKVGTVKYCGVLTPVQPLGCGSAADCGPMPSLFQESG